MRQAETLAAASRGSGRIWNNEACFIVVCNNTSTSKLAYDERPIKAVLDSYNPVGSTAHVRFNTSRTNRWKTDPTRCHVNWVVLDSDREAESCRVAESHPRVRAYVKNHNLGLEYLPDFIVLVDARHGVQQARPHPRAQGAHERRPAHGRGPQEHAQGQPVRDLR